MSYPQLAHDPPRRLREIIGDLVYDACNDASMGPSHTPDSCGNDPLTPIVESTTDAIMERIAEYGPQPTTIAPSAARRSDPDTSQQSAGSRGLRLDQVKPGHRSWKVLRAYWPALHLPDNQAALIALNNDPRVRHETIKSWARTCTELRRLGLIERTGKVVGAMVCRLTLQGHDIIQDRIASRRVDV